MNEIVLLSRAWHFAAQAHADQRRKGEAGEPYVNHLAEVAEIVATATEGKDINLVAAALLHDTVEDTAISHDEIVETFNADIAALVAEVTDDKSLKKAERKRLQVVNAPKKTDRAKILKLADKTSNLRAMAESPPADWSLERRRDYLNWGIDVAAGMRGVNDWIEEQFDAAAARLKQALA